MRRRVVSGDVQNISIFQKGCLVYSVLKLITLEGERNVVYGHRLGAGFRGFRVAEFIETRKGPFWNRKIIQEVRFSNPGEDYGVEFSRDYWNEIVQDRARVKRDLTSDCF